MSNRLSLYRLMIVAPIAWGGLLLFTRFVPPQTTLAFITFFLLLSVAQTCTITPIAYVIGTRLLVSRRYRTTIRHALRQSALLSLVIVLNLILRALHSWNIFMTIVIFVAAVVVEVLSLARK